MYMQEQGAVGAQQYYEAHKVCRLMLSPVCCQSIKPISSLFDRDAWNVWWNFMQTVVMGLQRMLEEVVKQYSKPGITETDQLASNVLF